ncbi:putative serine/threonine-protein phosphatase 4 regulatory subunit 3-like [Capsicum annuum]|nr:putative serine/threonine-protein phosphatase 4 regulatory subunit 3-like [Capsicum annuum]
MNSNSLDTRSLLHGFDKGGLFDLGHPLLNRIAESFFKAAGVPVEILPAYHQRSLVPGRIDFQTLEVKSTGKESVQWGLAAGMYSGLTYGLKETRGVHDWFWPSVASVECSCSCAVYVSCGLSRGCLSIEIFSLQKNSALAGAITGAALAFTLEDRSHEQVVQCAITGAAISTAANLLTGIF